MARARSNLPDRFRHNPGVRPARGEISHPAPHAPLGCFEKTARHRSLKPFNGDHIRAAPATGRAWVEFGPLQQLAGVVFLGLSAVADRGAFNDAPLLHDADGIADLAPHPCHA